MSAELEAETAQQREKEGTAVRQFEEEYQHGQALLGFSKVSGHLMEAENYDEVVTVLEDMITGDLSKRKAEAKLDTTRTTIRTSIKDRREFYGLT